MSRQGFVDVAGHAADGVIFPLLYRSSPNTTKFEKAFHDRFKRQENYLSAHTYDTVTLLLEAIRQAGLNRQAIRDAIKTLSPWQGVTGTILWDQQGSNTRPVVMGTLLHGKAQPLIIWPETQSSNGPQ